MVQKSAPKDHATNPSGKLAFSWEKKWEDCAAFGNYPEYGGPRNNTYKEGVFLGYRWFGSKGIDPLFPFGFGLSYTTFSYSDLKVAEAKNGSFIVTVTIKNSGTQAGSESVQLYVAPPPGDVPRPVRELKGFAKTDLRPGESKTVSMSFNRQDLAYWNPDSKQWTTAPGNYKIFVGPSSANLPLEATISIP